MKHRKVLARHLLLRAKLAAIAAACLAFGMGIGWADSNAHVSADHGIYIQEHVKHFPGCASAGNQPSKHDPHGLWVFTCRKPFFLQIMRADGEAL